MPPPSSAVAELFSLIHSQCPFSVENGNLFENGDLDDVQPMERLGSRRVSQSCLLPSSTLQYPSTLLIAAPGKPSP